MFKANVLEVFIASPSDVQLERKIVSEILDDWNIINSKSKKVVLRSLSWENDIYSSMSQGRAQEDINKQILEHADLLIGIFWTKIGTPTGNYISGSVEEIEKHIDTGKPTMLFFSDVPVRFDSVDNDQYTKMKEFRKWCMDKGLVNTYESNEEFSNIFRKQLGLFMNQDNKILEITELDAVDDEVLERTLTPGLSENAKQLLVNISQDPHGILMTVMTLGGYHVQTNGKNFGGDRYDARLKAELDGAIEELEDLQLIKATNLKRESFNITAKGYETADLLNKTE
jgi:hypothetical protein